MSTDWIDYSWSRPDFTPYAGVLRYLETGGSRPDLTVEEAANIHAAGKPIGLIWQTTGSFTGGGYEEGKSHAQRANDAADAVGAPDTCVVFYAVDSSSLTPEMVKPFFDGAREVSKRPVGLYGSYKMVEWAHSYGIEYCWQTLAWSNGLVSDHANIYQRTFESQYDLSQYFKPFPAWEPAMGGAPVTKNFRGADVDPLTYDFLVDLAASSGSIYINPIDGYGSYRSNASSAGTDTGGGHVDINAENMTDAQAIYVETLARQRGGCAYFRRRTWYSASLGKWITPGWQRHIHVLLMGVPDLSDAALKQINEYKAGGDGLVGSDPDTGNRNFVNMTWQKYLALKQELEEMALTADEIADAVVARLTVEHPTLKTTDGKPVYWSFKKAMWSMWYYVYHTAIRDTVDEAEIARLVTAQITEPLKEVVAQTISQAPVGATPEAIAEAVSVELSKRIAS